MFYFNFERLFEEFLALAADVWPFVLDSPKLIIPLFYYLAALTDPSRKFGAVVQHACKQSLIG